MANQANLRTQPASRAGTLLVKTMTMSSVDVVKCQAREPGLEPQVQKQYAAVAAEVNPLRRNMQSCNSQNSPTEALSLPDRIEQLARAFTAAELSRMLPVSRIGILNT